MGLFDWLLPLGSRSFPRPGKKVTIAPDRIWLTKKAKFDGIRSEIARELADPNGPDAVFLVAHFQDCAQELRSLVAGAGWDQSRVLVVCADALEGHSATGDALSESQNVLIVVAERHPLPSHDEAIAEFARSLPCRCRIAYHLSLEDAVLRAFFGPWAEQMLRHLGMKEDKAIESAAVSKQLTSALKKFEARAARHLPADSAEQWIERNCPELGRR